MARRVLGMDTEGRLIEIPIAGDKGMVGSGGAGSVGPQGEKGDKGDAGPQGFVIGWVSDGANLYETGRTAAMVA